MGWLEEWSDVGRSLHASSRALGRWTFADFTVGLTYLRERQRLAYELDPGLKARGLRGRPRVAPERLRELEWACELADIAYSGDEEVMRKFLSEFGLVLVHGETESSWRSPAFFWAYSKAADGGGTIFSAGSGGSVGHPGPRPAHLEATTPTDPPVRKVGHRRAHSGTLSGLLLHSAGALLPSFHHGSGGRQRAQSPAFRDDGNPFRGKVWDDCCCATR